MKRERLRERSRSTTTPLVDRSDHPAPRRKKTIADPLAPRNRRISRRFSRHLSTSSLLSQWTFNIRPWRRRHNAEPDGTPSFITTATSVANFRSKLFIIDANDMCLCGLLSISHSVNLVICIEVFFALVLLIQSPDLLTMNGTYFYFLGMFDGGGIFFFTLHVTVCVSCVFTSILLYIGSRKELPWLVLPHSFWQFSFILLSLASIIALMGLGFSGKMLLPSAIVLSSMMTFAGACEVWWCLLTVEYYRHMCTQKLQPPWSIDPIVFSKNSVV